MFILKAEIEPNTLFPNSHIPKTLRFCLERILEHFPTFRSCYMDRHGEIVVRFTNELEEKDISYALFLLDVRRYPEGQLSPYFDGKVEYEKDYEIDFGKNQTLIYSPEGIDYRKESF